VQYESLTRRQIAKDFAEPPQVGSREDLALDPRRRILDCPRCVTIGHGHGAGKRRFDAAAASQRTPPIIDPTRELLLKSIFYMLGTVERIASRPQHQLERRLAKAILEVLHAQAASVHPDESLASLFGHTRNDLGWIGRGIFDGNTHRALLRRHPAARTGGQLSLDPSA
jgi:hypothetical protein